MLTVAVSAAEVAASVVLGDGAVSQWRVVWCNFAHVLHLDVLRHSHVLWLNPKQLKHRLVDFTCIPLASIDM